MNPAFRTFYESTEPIEIRCLFHPCYESASSVFLEPVPYFIIAMNSIEITLT